MQTPQSGCTFQPIPNTPQVTARLAATQAGKNSHAEEFAEAATVILANFETFTVNDFYNILRHQMPGTEIRKLFERWSRSMVQIGRIKELPRCYDDPVFTPIGV